jgi:putative oxidoreductase
VAKSASVFQPYAHALLRLVAAFCFLLHGCQKLLGLFGGMHGASVKFPSELWFAGVIELVGGLLIFMGLFTRPVAFLLCGEMAVAYFTAHFPHGFWPVKNGGEPAVLYCFIFLFLCAAGAGPLSLDQSVRKK